MREDARAGYLHPPQVPQWPHQAHNMPPTVVDARELGRA